MHYVGTNKTVFKTLETFGKFMSCVTDMDVGEWMDLAANAIHNARIVRQEAHETCEAKGLEHVGAFSDELITATENLFRALALYCVCLAKSKGALRLSVEDTLKRLHEFSEAIKVAEDE